MAAKCRLLVHMVDKRYLNALMHLTCGHNIRKPKMLGDLAVDLLNVETKFIFSLNPNLLVLP